MDNKNILFVTAFKDINRKNFKAYSRNNYEYFSHFLNLANSIKYNLVCYISEFDKEFFKNINFPDNIIFENINKLENYFKKYNEQNSRIMKTEKYQKLIPHSRKLNPEHCEPEYNTIMYMKIECLKQSKDKYPNYNFYSWIDFGCCRENYCFKIPINMELCGDKPYSFALPTDIDFEILENKITFHSFNKPDFNIKIHEYDMLKTDQIFFDGSQFIVDRNLLDKFYDLWNEKLNYWGEINITDDDQNLVLQLYYDNPSMFNLIISDEWYSLYYYIRLKKKIKVTNPLLESVGFGENYKMLIYSMVFAELNDLEFYYTPFKIMEHVSKYEIILLENMINLSELKVVSDSENIQPLNQFKLLSFFEKNINKFSSSKSLELLKTKFQEYNKDPFDKNFMNICIHIRRMNDTDKNRLGDNKDIILAGMDVPNELYIDTINQFENAFAQNIEKCKFHIYSQGDEKNFEIFKKDNVILHLNEDLSKTFTEMVYADILITAPSSLSYTAGMLSKNTVYYIKHCNKPLTNWNIVQGYESSKIRFEYILPINGILTPGIYNPETEIFKYNSIPTLPPPPPSLNNDEYLILFDTIWKYTQSFLYNEIKPLIIGGGCNKGEVFINKMQNYFPYAEVHTFEPCLESFEFSKNRIINTSFNINIYNYGISDKNEEGILNISTSSNTNSMYSVNEDYINITDKHTDKNETIKLITLDYFYKYILKQDKDIDLLYLNIEGHELNALKGATGILNKIKIIWLEVNFIELWKGCAMFKEVDKFMIEHNFYLSMHSKRNWFRWSQNQCIVVYINRKYYYP